MKASDAKIGTKILCPECGSPIKVPESNTVKKESIGSGVAASELAGNLLRGSGSSKTPDSAFSTQNSQISFDTAVKKPKISFDFWGTIYDLSSTFIPIIAAIIILVGGTYWLSSSVMRKKIFIPELAPVHGVIMLDKKPLANAFVYFKAKKATKGSKIGTAIGKTDDAGHYELRYLTDEYPGAVVGLNKVRIQAADSNGRSLISSEYAGRTTLSADVISGENNEFNFELKPRE
jgi:hypothetical protein